MKYGLALAAILLLSCNGQKKTGNFDHLQWQQDKQACGQIRSKLAPELEKIRRDLLGSSQSEIIDILGRPDQQLLYERTQKFYVYFLEPGPQCEGKSSESRARTVSVRFNALGLASEIVYANGKPI